MTTHRTLSDSEFDTHTSSLTTASLSAKLTAWRALQTDLTTESTSIIEAQREQLYKHRAKVDDMVTDLETLESFQAAGGGGDPLPAGKRIYVDAAWGGSTKDGTRETPYSDLGLALDAKCAPTDAVTRVFVLATGTYQISATKGEIEKTGAGIGQDITIVGAGSGKTIIQKADLSADCLKLQKFGREMRLPVILHWYLVVAGMLVLPAVTICPHASPSTPNPLIVLWLQFSTSLSWTVNSWV